MVLAPRRSSSPTVTRPVRGRAAGRGRGRARGRAATDAARRSRSRIIR